MNACLGSHAEANAPPLVAVHACPPSIRRDRQANGARSQNAPLLGRAGWAARMTVHPRIHRAIALRWTRRQPAGTDDGPHRGSPVRAETVVDELADSSCHFVPRELANPLEARLDQATA